MTPAAEGCPFCGIYPLDDETGMHWIPGYLNWSMRPCLAQAIRQQG